MPGRMTGDAYDVAVVGGGTGGYATAIRAAELGKSVALIERDDRLGGTCLLRGCIPTKALLQSAELMDHVNRSQEWGIEASGAPDWPGILAFQKKIVDKLVKGLTGLVEARKIDVVHGEGRLAAGPTVEVNGRPIVATDIVIASGSYPKLLPGLSVTDRVVTSDQALALGYLPASVVVIGAGAVGLEFASFYRSMGADVTIIEALSLLAPLEDEEISKQLARAFRKRGIKTDAPARLKDVTEHDDRVELTYEAGGSDTTVGTDICLVAVGRGPVTEGLGFEEAGVELDRGFVKVNGGMATTAPHVWAVGDVASSPLQFAHVAFAEGITTAERIAGKEPPEIDYAGVPRVTFCTPEISSVGLTEEQARERGHEIDVVRYPFQGLGKANIVGDGGIAKVIAEPDGGQIFGIHLLGPHVTDLISEAMLITNWEAAAADVASLIHPHPTLSEAIGESALALAGKPLHTA